MNYNRENSLGYVDGSQVGYWRMQSLRQENIRDAVVDQDTSADQLVHMYGIAQKGLRLAFHYGATESDALTFINLQRDIRDRLMQSPIDDVQRALARISMHEAEQAS